MNEPIGIQLTRLRELRGLSTAAVATALRFAGRRACHATDPRQARPWTSVAHADAPRPPEGSRMDHLNSPLSLGLASLAL